MRRFDLDLEVGADLGGEEGFGGSNSLDRLMLTTASVYCPLWL